MSDQTLLLLIGGISAIVIAIFIFGFITFARFLNREQKRGEKFKDGGPWK